MYVGLNPYISLGLCFTVVSFKVYLVLSFPQSLIVFVHGAGTLKANIYLKKKNIEKWFIGHK